MMAPTTQKIAMGMAPQPLASQRGAPSALPPTQPSMSSELLVVDGSANIADIIGSINWVALNAQLPAVISMSVGTEMISQPLQLAVNNTVSLYNLSIVAAAGNAATDSCMNTPSRSVYVTSVGATDITDKISEFSNNGKCVNVYAPGTLIYCANLNSTYRVISGTSMSCPIVSGIVGQYLEYNSSLTTWGITDVLYKSRSRGSLLSGTRSTQSVSSSCNTPLV